MKQNIVVYGATSGMTQEAMRFFAAEACSFVLIGRNQEHLNVVANDLKMRGAESTYCIATDLSKIEEAESIFNEARRSMSKIEMVFVAHGILGDHDLAKKSVSEVAKIFQINSLSYFAILTVAANYFEETKSGKIAVITSVAGERGRQSNYIYGASKAAVITFIQGLRNRLSKSNVQVLELRPGIIDTAMTKHLEKKPLVVSASVAGQEIFQAIRRGHLVSYIPRRWRFVMLIIRSIPERIFMRLSL